MKINLFVGHEMMKILWSQNFVILNQKILWAYDPKSMIWLRFWNPGKVPGFRGIW